MTRTQRNRRAQRRANVRGFLIVFGTTLAVLLAMVCIGTLS